MYDYEMLLKQKEDLRKRVAEETERKIRENQELKRRQQEEDQRAQPSLGARQPSFLRQQSRRPENTRALERGDSDLAIKLMREEKGHHNPGSPENVILDRGVGGHELLGILGLVLAATRVTLDGPELPCTSMKLAERDRSVADGAPSTFVHLRFEPFHDGHPINRLGHVEDPR